MGWEFFLLIETLSFNPKIKAGFESAAIGTKMVGTTEFDE